LYKIIGVVDPVVLPIAYRFIPHYPMKDAHAINFRGPIQCPEPLIVEE
jgi:hypothetical protein